MKPSPVPIKLTFIFQVFISIFNEHNGYAYQELQNVLANERKEIDLGFFLENFGLNVSIFK